MTVTRRSLIALSLSAPVLSFAPRALAEEAGPITGDIVLGDENAPVTVYEYASLTCPHCAAFHRDTYPSVKANYVDTGKVKFIMREVYFDRYGLWAAMVARCGGEGAYYPIIDEYLKTQSSWTKDDDIVGAIRRVGVKAGLMPADIDACMNDEGFARTLVERYQAQAEEHDVNSTPTFIINGVRHRGNIGATEFARILDEALSS
ncbi:MAG: DsbA family protein [Pseudomonadota bacterium]